MLKFRYFAPLMLLLTLLLTTSAGADRDEAAEAEEEEAAEAEEAVMEIDPSEVTTEKLIEWFKERNLVHNFEGVECDFCHSNPALKTKLQSPTNRVRDYYVDPEEYKNSVHFEEGMESCADCHDDSCMTCAKPSHVIGCFDCHEEDEGEQSEARESVAHSVHSDFMKGKCADCHNPHYIKRAVDMTLTEKNSGCLECHEDKSGNDKFTLAKRHAWHPQASLHLSRIACIACHTQPSDESATAFKHLILPSEQAARACEECHAADGRMMKYLIDIGEAPKTGLSTEQMIEQFYFSGGTRNKVLDKIGLILILLALAGVVVHGLVRILRRRK